MSGFLDELAAPAVTSLFAPIDALPIVLMELANGYRAMQRRRRSSRAQQGLADALTAISPWALHPHMTI